MNKPPFIGAALLLACTIFVGCGSGSGLPDNAEETLSTYFEAYATDDSAEMEKMIKASAPGTPARLYAEHQINLAIANESDNVGQAPSNVTVDGQTVTLVNRGLPADATTEAREEATTTYRDFQYGQGGGIKTWVSEPGGPLAPRIRAQSAKESTNGVQVELKTSYLTNAGDLFITLEVNNQSSQEAWVTPESYTNRDNRQVEVSATPYQAELAAGNFATMLLTISNGETGGDLNFNVYFPDSFSDDNSLTLSVKR